MNVMNSGMIRVIICICGLMAPVFRRWIWACW